MARNAEGQAVGPGQHEDVGVKWRHQRRTAFGAAFASTELPDSAANTLPWSYAIDQLPNYMTGGRSPTPTGCP